MKESTLARSRKSKFDAADRTDFSCCHLALHFTVLNIQSVYSLHGSIGSAEGSDHACHEGCLVENVESAPSEPTGKTSQNPPWSLPTTSEDQHFVYQQENLEKGRTGIQAICTSGKDGWGN